MLQFAEHEHNEDMGGIESFVNLDAGFADDEYEVRPLAMTLVGHKKLCLAILLPPSHRL